MKGTNEPCNDSNWTITLTGAKAGAGTYSGHVDYISCSTNSAGDWLVAFQTDMKGDVYGATAQVHPQTISVNTRWARDDPGDWDWQAAFNTPGAVTITGDTSQEPWTVHVDANWDEYDPAGHPIPLKVSIDVVCTDVTMGP